jgi:CBS domain-containing protein
MKRSRVEMRTARRILEQKGPAFWSIAPGATVYEALSLMAERNIGALLVLDEEELVGVFSERDYARKVVLLNKTSRETPVREIMSREIVSVGPDQSIVECMDLMTERHIRHLPVLEAGKPVGVVSIGDVVKGMLEEKEFLIAQMSNYIAGTR